MKYNPRTETIDPSKIKLISTFTPDAERLVGLRNSIKENGLLHPPAVKDNREIITGRLRILACVGILDEIEVKVYPSDLDDTEYRAIALHENLKRYNLPWYEEVTQEAELHELRQAEHGPGKQGKKVGWSLRDTAEELNMAVGYLSEDLRMAQAVMADPNLKKIQDKTTARRVILNSIKRITQEQGANAPVNIETDKLHLGSSEEILKLYNEYTFDACITDPPWLEFRDFSLTRDQFTLPVFKEVYRVLKANSFLFAFVSTQDWIYYQEKLKEIGFQVQKYPMVWIKEGVLTHGNRSWETQRDYEPIIVAVKGSPILTSNMISSIISCKVVPSASMIHPNEKPDIVIKRLLDYCSYEGSIVLDPFMGSGVVPFACRQLRRRYIGIEKNKTHFSNIERRMK